MGNEVLLPCPECGGIPELKEDVISVHLDGILTFFPILRLKYKVLCRCGNSMESPEVAYSKEAKNEAINKLIHEWNRKATVPEYWHNRYRTGIIESMSRDEYFELLEEQQEHEVVLHPSRIDAEKKCSNDYCEIDFSNEG